MTSTHIFYNKCKRKDVTHETYYIRRATSGLLTLMNTVGQVIKTSYLAGRTRKRLATQGEEKAGRYSY